MNVMRVYTKHGNDAHLMNLDALVPDVRQQTICGHDAFALRDRSMFWRRRLKMASLCFECATGQTK